MPGVLVIDDNPLQLRTREAVLRGAGLQVSVATSAEAALALLRSGPLAGGIGVIVTDHVLPGASGAEFVRMLREVNSTVPVVVLSGRPDIEEEYAGLHVTFRQKPLAPQELVALVSSALRRAA